MINRIIEACAHSKFIVLLVVGMLTLVGLWSIKNITLDAIPDLSDTQVIIYSNWDRSPDIMEDQVTYPIISSLLGVPKVKRHSWFFGLRLFICLHHLRGWNRHLLGSLANA